MKIIDGIASGLTAFYAVSKNLPGSSIIYKTDGTYEVMEYVTLQVNKARYEPRIVTTFVVGDRGDPERVNLYDVVSVTYLRTDRKKYYDKLGVVTEFENDDVLPTGYHAIRNGSEPPVQIWIDKALTIRTASEGVLSYTVEKVDAGVMYAD